jgi:hypothetical protein
MTVKQLIELLRRFDPEFPVYMSKDEEGNGFAPIAPTNDERADTVSINKVIPARWGWTDEIYELTDDAPDEAKTVLILWPDA